MTSTKDIDNLIDVIYASTLKLGGREIAKQAITQALLDARIDNANSMRAGFVARVVVSQQTNHPLHPDEVLRDIDKHIEQLKAQRKGESK